MKGLFILAVLFLVAGFIWMPDDSEAPAARTVPASQLNPAGIFAAVLAMPAMQQVQVKLQNLRTAFYIYVEEFGDVPEESEGLRPLTGLTGMVSSTDITDPWGSEFIYRCIGTRRAS
jgi:hypothetical protein